MAPRSTPSIDSPNASLAPKSQKANASPPDGAVEIGADSGLRPLDGVGKKPGQQGHLVSITPDRSPTPVITSFELSQRSLYVVKIDKPV
jgi:hypothetical protein